MAETLCRRSPFREAKRGVTENEIMSQSVNRLRKDGPALAVCCCPPRVVVVVPAHRGRPGETISTTDPVRTRRAGDEAGVVVRSGGASPGLARSCPPHADHGADGGRG